MPIRKKSGNLPYAPRINKLGSNYGETYGVIFSLNANHKQQIFILKRESFYYEICVVRFSFNNDNFFVVA